MLQTYTCTSVPPLIFGDGSLSVPKDVCLHLYLGVSVQACEQYPSVVFAGVCFVLWICDETLSRVVSRS